MEKGNLVNCGSEYEASIETCAQSNPTSLESLLIMNLNRRLKQLFH
ncbi:hypothetical protein Hdeb2414_s0114g00799321 [Helianthus debilis subsp. tardiflorus]